MSYEDELVKNYKSLAEDRGWSDETMAGHIAAGGARALSEEYAEAYPGEPSKAAPKKRAAKADAETIEG